MDPDTVWYSVLEKAYRLFMVILNLIFFRLPGTCDKLPIYIYMYAYNYI